MRSFWGRENNFKFCPMCGQRLTLQEVDDRIRPICPGCGWIHYLNPPPVVCAVCYVGEDILLVKRAVEPKKGLWALPGGFMEIGESPIEACLRELEEEAGIKSIETVEIISAEYQQSRRYGSVVVIGYAVEAKDISQAPAGDDAEEIRWFSIKNRPKMPFDSFEEILRKWESKR